jgi:hypothetical protein
MFLRDNPAMMAEVESKVKEVLGFRPPAVVEAAEQEE